jgi:hypothetical protein
MSQGSLMIFLHPPITLPLVIAAAIIGSWPWLAPMVRRMRGKEPGKSAGH